MLTNGKVLITGGENVDGRSLASAELYDPAAGTFSPTGSLVTGRSHQTTTLLPNGKVLLAGGLTTTVIPASAELYDSGLGFLDSWRPVISPAPPSLTQPAAMMLTGSGFRGNSEGSSGSTTNSPTNYPLLLLQRIDNDQMLFVGASAPWSDTSFTSATLSGLALGYYRVSILTNGIPSIQSLISVAPPE